MSEEDNIQSTPLMSNIAETYKPPSNLSESQNPSLFPMDLQKATTEASQNLASTPFGFPLMSAMQTGNLFSPNQLQQESPKDVHRIEESPVPSQDLRSSSSSASTELTPRDTAAPHHSPDSLDLSTKTAPPKSDEKDNQPKDFPALDLASKAVLNNEPADLTASSKKSQVVDGSQSMNPPPLLSQDHLHSLLIAQQQLHQLASSNNIPPVSLPSAIASLTGQPIALNIPTAIPPVPMATPSSSNKTDQSAEDDEDDDDEDDEDMDDEDEDESGSKLEGMSSAQQNHHAITGRGVTLSMLMADEIIQPGPNTMSIDYLGQKFTADLLEDGSIRWKEANKLFNSPSAWAIHCKKIVNPMKKSGCGWASVRYKGKKLDAYKSSWLRKKRPLAMAAMAALGVSEEDDEESDGRSDTKTIKMDEESVCPSEGDSISHPPPVPSPDVIVKPERKPRLSVKHATLGRKLLMHDPGMLVECTPFAALGKIQPFSLSISNTALLSMDFHCHLSSSEVVGYLGGKWDAQTQHLSIERTFACLCRLDDKDAGPSVEKQIRADMDRSGLVLAGWYHSHPHTQPDPSLRDIEAQMEYQVQMKGSGDCITPCIALIISPYSQDAPGQEESSVNAVWVMAPPEHRPLDYGMPMRICYDITEDPGIPKYLLTDMKKQALFHQREPGAINFHDNWHHSGTYHTKLKASLSRKLPHDQQVDKVLLEFLNSLL